MIDTTLEKLYLVDNLENILPLPLAGVVASCGFTGFPSPAMDYEEKHLSIIDYLGIKKNKTWMFKATGQSMKDLGVLDGDMLIVDTSLSPEMGDLCICEVESEYVAKIVQYINGEIYLVSANADHKPIKLNEQADLMVFGVVTGRVGKISRRVGKAKSFKPLPPQSQDLSSN